MKAISTFVALTLLLVGCSMSGGETTFTTPTDVPQLASTPATHVTAQEAIELARSHVTMTEVVNALSGQYAELKTIPADRSIDPDRVVWAVRFTGDIEICPPSPWPCESPRRAMSTVYLDYATGTFLSTSTVSPG